MSSSLFQLTSTFTSFPSKPTPSIRTNRTHNGFKVSCNVTPRNDNENQLILPESQKLVLPNNNVDRRNLLLGVGGICSAASLNSLPSAFARPIKTPDIRTNCKDIVIDNPVRTQNCCPPSIGKTIKNFTFPTEKTVRMRWPAHTGSKENIEKYKNAIKAMKALPDQHPHSFTNQAKIHCAYCDGAYTQVDCGFPLIPIQVHNSWLFFPFHRWYLYFHERILGKLINDPTFALPYWNWDNPEGMELPAIFTGGEDNPLYDVYRDVRHLPPKVVDLAFDSTKPENTPEEQIEYNLCTVYRDLIRNGTDAKSFFGGEYVAGDECAKYAGSVEGSSHNAVHRWVGDPTQPNHEDMGIFYSAGYDPVFYAHHANVDRMWKLWKDLGIPGHVEPTKDDWLKVSYVFYNEKEELVRVCNKDCVDPAKLNFGYMESELPWSKSSSITKITRTLKSATVWSQNVKTVDQISFPASVERILKVKVKRPAVNRSAVDKANANEILLINGIKFNSEKFVKFDVFVNGNVEDVTQTTPCDIDLAGSFSQIPHSNTNGMLMTSAARFGLTELLEDTETEGEEYAVVTLVPRAGYEDLTASEIKIELVPIA